MKATLKNARISPKKLRVVANLVRGKSVNDGLAMLRLFPKKGSEILYKVLFSAASNAIHNDGAPKDDLVIHTLSSACAAGALWAAAGCGRVAGLGC